MTMSPRLRDQRQRQQQRGEELAGHVAAHADRLRRWPARRRLAAAGAAAGSRAGPGRRSSQPSGRSASTRSPIGRSCMRGTPRSSKRPPCVAASTASAAVSGRMAVPALPRNSSASCTAQPAAEAGDVQHAVAVAAAAPQPSCAQRVEHHARVVGVQQVVHRGRALGQAGQQQHAVGDALGARQAHACRRRRAAAAGRGTGCRTSAGRRRRAASAVSAAAAGVPICQLARAFGWRCAIRSSSASALPSRITCSSASQRVAEALRLLQHLFAVGHQDVAPDRRVAGGDAREVAEARAGQRQEVAARPAG